MKDFPDNLSSLHRQEEKLRCEALTLVANDPNLLLHITVVEQAMSLGELFRQFQTDDQDLKVIQLLGMRMFNAFGASLKLALSGYGQNSAILMRDILETVFLIDLFRGNRSLIAQWRSADKKARMKDFSPVRVREALDKRDGFTGKKRDEIYEMFSVLAAHPNMNSSLMMRQQKGGDIFIGPFIEVTSLDATLAEMGRLAIQGGQQLVGFFPADWEISFGPRKSFSHSMTQWMATFYPQNGMPRETAQKSS
jgi:hypothetical protein